MDELTLRIDILAEPVSDIVAKLFYQATEGKVHQYGTEMAVPECVNPLSAQEVREWDTRALKVQRVKVSRVPERHGSRKHTKAAAISIRSSAEPFYGYRSEPPSVVMFKDTQPVGHIASAIRAAGELSAMALKNGEDDTKIWKAIENCYGIDTTVVKKYVIPDTSGSSIKDMIKFGRQSTHMLYGFNSRAPSVTVDGGSYRPETIDRPYLIDYHRLYLSLRWIGEYLSRYGSLFNKANDRILFAPVFAEAEEYTTGVFSENIKIPDNLSKNVNCAIAAAAESTMKYFEGSIESYGVASRVKLASSRVRISIDGEATADLLLELGNQRVDKKVHLDRSALFHNVKREVAEIRNDSKKSFGSHVFKGIKHLKGMYEATWRSVVPMALEMMFTCKTFTSQASGLLHHMRHVGRYCIMNDKEREKMSKAVALLLPKDIGFLVFMLFMHLSANERVAKVKFLATVQAISKSDVVNITSNYSESLISAVASTTDLKVFMDLVQKGFNRSSTLVHSTKHLTIEARPGMGMVEIFDAAVGRYVDRKAIFWSNHYNSRVIDENVHIQECSRCVRTREKLIKKPPSHIAFRNSDEVADWVDDREAEKDKFNAMISAAKANTITYGFLRDAYRVLTYTMDETFRVRVKLSSEDYRKILIKICENYVRKRNTWGDKLSKMCDNWPEAKLKILVATRLSDMAAIADNALCPKVPWKTLLDVSIEKFKVTQNSLTRVLRERAANSDNDEEDAEEDKIEVDEMKKIDYLVHGTVDTLIKDRELSNNMYDVLQYDSDSNTSEESSSSNNERSTGNKAKTESTRGKKVAPVDDDDWLDAYVAASKKVDIKELDDISSFDLASMFEDKMEVVEASKTNIENSCDDFDFAEYMSVEHMMFVTSARLTIMARKLNLERDHLRGTFEDLVKWSKVYINDTVSVVSNIEVDYDEMTEAITGDIN